MKSRYLVFSLVFLGAGGIFALPIISNAQQAQMPQQVQPVKPTVVAPAQAPVQAPQAHRAPPPVQPSQPNAGTQVQPTPMVPIIQPVQQPQMQQQQVQQQPAAQVQQQAVPMDMNAIPQQQDNALKNVIENQFKDLLSFPLSEEKMIAYVQAARRVQRINDKWDVQIASTESDKTAIEYNNYSVEEIMASLQKIPELTLDQYNEMTRLISTNPEFNRVYLAYRDLVEQGVLGAKPEAATPPAAEAPQQPAQAAQTPVQQKPVQQQPAQRQPLAPAQGTGGQGVPQPVGR